MAQRGNGSAPLPSLLLSRSICCSKKHSLDIGPQGIQWEESSKKQLKAEFPKKFWEKLLEEDLQHASLPVSCTNLSGQNKPPDTPTEVNRTLRKAASSPHCLEVKAITVLQSQAHGTRPGWAFTERTPPLPEHKEAEPREV